MAASSENVTISNKQIIDDIIMFLRECVTAFLNKDKEPTTPRFEKLMLNAVSMRSHFKMKITRCTCEDLDVFRDTLNGIINLCLRTIFLYINNILEGPLTKEVFNRINQRIVDAVQTAIELQDMSFNVAIGVELKRCIKILLGHIREHCVRPSDMADLYSYQDALIEVGRLDDSLIALTAEIDTSLEYFMGHMAEFNEVEIKAQHAEVILLYLHIIIRIIEGQKHRTQVSRRCTANLMRHLQKLSTFTQNSILTYAIMHCLNSLDSLQSNF